MLRLIVNLWRRLMAKFASDVVVEEPEIIGYAAVVMTSGRKLVLGQPHGSDGWAATTVVPIRDGENGFSRALHAAEAQCDTGGSPALTWGLRSVWRVDGQLRKVEWWFRDIGDISMTVPAGFATVAIQDPYAVLNGSVRRANSTVPLLPLRLIESFTRAQSSSFLRR